MDGTSRPTYATHSPYTGTQTLRNVTVVRSNSRTTTGPNPARDTSSPVRQTSLSKITTFSSLLRSTPSPRPQPAPGDQPKSPTSKPVDISDLGDHGPLPPAKAGRLSGIVGGTVVGASVGVVALFIVSRNIRRRKQRDVIALNLSIEEVSRFS
ncbi:hypothetical protein AJ80_01092 [Polytolypa hystricis UAMH7299]|uniref:Uncharacterized protein n=1 Tax=Polytolypa hystricis (strain UAMH7299) TaxID=1447883 RepID=A0A2B7YZM5_POLH7|nr:hypothetical protein AJ80_01092 [Polytolypa hystricis UAMH7299]